MHDEIIFSPDPRTDQNGFIGVNDDSEYDSINIHLHSNGADGSVAALLERNETDYYQLLLYDKSTKSFDDKKVFTETYDVNTICDKIEQWFDDRHLQAHLVGGRERRKEGGILRSYFQKIIGNQRIVLLSFIIKASR